MKDLAQTFEYLKRFLTEERLAKIEHFSPESSDFVLPVLEDVYQFRNAAAIVRSVEACGFHKVVALQEENNFEPNLRVTKGADTWVEVEKLPRTIDSLQEIKNRGYKIVAVSLENNAKMLPEYEVTEPMALVFGTEMEGVSQEILDFADETLAIPMYGFTRSFNVSVAASICMYELKQKLIKSDIDYKLSEEKRLRMKIRWAVNSIRSGEEILNHYLTKTE
ncbi:MULTISPECIES: TrmH family RNA methyltransferase [Chryseobacterium]|uniref:tRNA (guanosine(18)-2'-O)-methyltransferase n=1 Tax=Chryseobacterium camelliae TaxID=1265445 RepID=A0ABU0TJW6_9FLAO|nr:MULTISPECIES: RNA methyltransferase [Chryseobacterium]MDT3408825.1 tRNA (guanosine-2'-O-)-methyltransferase [Pseudacidovorax intermedius]MDQ1097317.1 tRNA (guanosine-2'-O-)-methyltransferase [Chryseobacterium camelliae]MDQ1101251.1 tRNA (guanosine-2'-O-)-methyltransferase [Chryseobacterium sp. SORGH_AS_1048]MDR6084696.1 tRNA (guanosine-2'-O-)-methyltransferase [Chryseobacterium sp. SORGH_AS_0909]MDR6132969.1 tRNA (guanosine-2'-O-)-methyltransferase [Chryseobacterium sp. SORGH_AS_1175]